MFIWRQRLSDDRFALTSSHQTDRAKQTVMNLLVFGGNSRGIHRVHVYAIANPEPTKPIGTEIFCVLQWTCGDGEMVNAFTWVRLTVCMCTGMCANGCACGRTNVFVRDDCIRVLGIYIYFHTCMCTPCMRCILCQGHDTMSNGMNGKIHTRLVRMNIFVCGEMGQPAVWTSGICRIGGIERDRDLYFGNPYMGPERRFIFALLLLLPNILWLGLLFVWYVRM